jgi:hypothetical protein
VQPKVFAFPDYPYQSTDIPKFLLSIQSWRSNHNGAGLRLCFGDSIAAFTRDYLSQIPPELNCAQPGSGFPNFLATARAVQPALRDASVHMVLVGSGGNAGLGGQALERILEDAELCIRGMRKLFPDARLIVYGWPPIYDLYATAIAPAVEERLKSLVIEDGNAVFLPLQKHFAGFLGLFPRINYSSDGVHLNRAGIIRFNELIVRAKMAPAGSVVD